VALAFAAPPGPLAAQSSPPPAVVRQSLDDAWWTGPLLANSAATLPQGHFLAEPYLYVVVAAHSNTVGSRSYLLYGLADRLSVGMIPYLAYNAVNQGPGSSGMGFGDQTLLAQYRLTQFHGGPLPTISVTVQETIPTGRYDQLGERPGDGLGSGAFATTLGAYSQTYFWLPNGRILRMRLDLTGTFSGTADVNGVSVYGTNAGFTGHAEPGNSFVVDSSLEYSLTRRWVLALDLFYEQSAATTVTGHEVGEPGSIPRSVHLTSPEASALGFAPAMEFSWKPNLGVIVGARVIPTGHNTVATITPAVAINYVH
jgi:hypothetical protein